MTARATRTRRGDSATTLPALTKGFWFAHLGWMFDLEHTNREQATRPI